MAAAVSLPLVLHVSRKTTKGREHSTSPVCSIRIGKATGSVEKLSHHCYPWKCRPGVAERVGKNSQQVWNCLAEGAETSDRRENSKPMKDLEARLVKRLSQTISEKQLLRPGQKILVAVSGGQDSMCLLHLLVKLKPIWGWRLSVVNCDHRWSASSREAASHVAQIAQNFNLDYYQAVSTGSVLGEGRARTWRYGVLQRVAVSHGCEVIVTAHTASDRVETLLYNLFRGTGISGLQSLTWKRWLNPDPSLSRQSAFQGDQAIHSCEDPELGTVPLITDSRYTLALVRPLLDVTRSELRELHQQMEMPLWPDPSNHFLDIDRNRIRHDLLPYLRKHFNKGIDKSLARWAEILHGEQLYLANLCATILAKAESEIGSPGGEKSLDVMLLKSLPVALQRRVLKQFTDSYTGKSLGFDAVERLRQVTCVEGSGVRNTFQVSIHGGYHIRLQGNDLIIARK